jgi:hypothetical protein
MSHRECHDAIDELRRVLLQRPGGWSIRNRTRSRVPRSVAGTHELTVRESRNGAPFMRADGRERSKQVLGSAGNEECAERGLRQRSRSNACQRRGGINADRDDSPCSRRGCRTELWDVAGRGRCRASATRRERPDGEERGSLTCTRAEFPSRQRSGYLVRRVHTPSFWFFGPSPVVTPHDRSALSKNRDAASLSDPRHGVPGWSPIYERVPAYVAKLWQMWRKGELVPSSPLVNVLSNEDGI